MFVQKGNYQHRFFLDTELASLFMTGQVNIVHDNNYIQGDSEKDSEIQGTKKKRNYTHIKEFTNI